jgi:hypothetical protein
MLTYTGEVDDNVVAVWEGGTGGEECVSDGEHRKAGKGNEQVSLRVWLVSIPF